LAEKVRVQQEPSFGVAFVISRYEIGAFRQVCTGPFRALCGDIMRTTHKYARYCGTIDPGIRFAGVCLLLAALLSASLTGLFVWQMIWGLST
jgi:hypothetical protein